jgi:CubicO group peptidase (beta-lactamase class C family)
MQLEAGRLQLNTTVMEIFPYLPLTGRPRLGACGCQAEQGYFARSPYACNTTFHPSWQNVTVVHLLTHSSGLEAINGQLEFNSVALDERALEASSQQESCSGYPLPSRRLHLQNLFQLAIPSPPGSLDTPGSVGWADVTDFVVLGAVLEELHSEPWEAIIQRELFDPLGMSTAGFGVPAAQVPLSRRAVQPYGHRNGDDGLHSTDEDRAHAWAPASGVHASMADWARWTACHVFDDRDASAALSPSNSSDSPGLLRASWWRFLHRPYVFAGSPAVHVPYTPSALEQLASNADGSYLNRQGMNAGDGHSRW